jgi:hypothetical protein
MFPGEPCEVCGMPYGGRGRVQRHHRDGDRLNNTRANVAFLCVKHHKDAHRALDGAVGGGARPRIAAMMRDRAMESAAVARRCRDAGWTTAEIADGLEVDPWTVLRWFRKYPE